MKKKLISAVLALVMVLGLLPMAALADAETTLGEDQVTVNLLESGSRALIETLSIEKGATIPCSKLLNRKTSDGKAILFWVATKGMETGEVYPEKTSITPTDGATEVTLLAVALSEEKVTKITFHGETERAFYLYKTGTPGANKNTEIWSNCYPSPSMGKKWVEDGRDFNGTMPTDDQDHTYTMVDEGASGETHEITEITVTEPPKDSTHGTATASPMEGVAGTRVTITVNLDSGYVVNEVLVLTASYQRVATTDSGNGCYAFTMPDDDVEVIVAIKADEGENPPAPPATEYTITVASAENGGVSTNTHKAAEGTEVTVTATPNEGYELDGITVTGADVTVTNGKFTMPAANVTVTATFKKISEEPVKPEPEQAAYGYRHGQGLFMGQLVLSDLTPNSKYVCQMAKAGTTSAAGCAIVIVETGADETTQTIEVLGNKDGYTVQLWKYPESGEVSSVGELTSVTLTKK